MSNIQQYQRYKPRREGPGFRFGKIGIILGIIVVVYLIGRSLFGHTPELPPGNSVADQNANLNIVADSNANTNGNSNTNSSNANSNQNTNSNSNASTNTATNTNTAIAGSFSVTKCNRLYSKGTADRKQISLTFNVGTTKEGELQKVLDALTSTNTAADFFVRGDVAEESTGLIAKIKSAGFPVYNLSYNHPHFNDLPASAVAEQLDKAEAVIAQQTGKTTKPFFRPPYGEADDDVLAAAKKDGYCPVTWSVDAMDWSSDYTAEQSKERVLSSASNGAIVLMQAGNATTAQIVPELITELKSRGFELVHLETLLS